MRPGRFPTNAHAQNVTANELEIAWAGGLFEGEGTIHADTAGHRVQLRIQMADEDALQRFAAAVGTGPVTGPYQHTNRRHKPLYATTICTQEEVERVLKLLWPYLGERRRARATELLEDRATFTSKMHRTCYCGKHFYAHHGKQKFCSSRCGWAMWKTWKAEKAALDVDAQRNPFPT